MYATKIKMKPGCGNSYNLLEIDSIYLTGANPEKYYKKSEVYDYLVNHPGTIKVNIWPYPTVVPAVSSLHEKYVRSSPDSYQRDNLLNLPRE